MDAIKEAKLTVYRQNFRDLLHTRTKKGSPERFKKRIRLNELNLKIKEIEESL